MINNSRPDEFSLHMKHNNSIGYYLGRSFQDIGFLVNFLSDSNKSFKDQIMVKFFNFIHIKFSFQIFCCTNTASYWRIIQHLEFEIDQFDKLNKN